MRTICDDPHGIDDVKRGVYSSQISRGRRGEDPPYCVYECFMPYCISASLSPPRRSDREYGEFEWAPIHENARAARHDCTYLFRVCVWFASFA